MERRKSEWRSALGVALALALVACSGNLQSTDDLGIDLAASGCSATCPPCASNSYCLASSTVAPGCRPVCHTDDDCHDATYCIGVQPGIPTDLDDTVPRFCAPKDEPLCAGAGSVCVIDDGQHCVVGEDTFAVSFMSNFGCAFEYQHCAHGCGRADGGIFPGCNP